MGARHRNTSERRLTRSQIVDAAVKIVGKDRARHADVEATVDYMSTLVRTVKSYTIARIQRLKSSLQSNTARHCAR